MELIYLISILVALLILLLPLLFFKKRNGEKDGEQNQPQRQNNAPLNRRIGRNRVVKAEQPQQQQRQNEENSINQKEIVFVKKMGTKKRAKLEAKEEKRTQREIELKAREEQRKKEAIAEEERRKQEEKATLEDKKCKETEKKAQEERERKDYEEYLKMKAQFEVQEEGFNEVENDQEEILQNFIDYIKNNKVVVLEELALKFKFKTQAAIDKIIELQKENRLTGFIDDRGKFIYISDEELLTVAKFIKQRGRVSISELAEYSSNLINPSSS
ncbi:hypothetical protein PVAND_007916 [Polypedilum vanderplanki]|uniref:DDRGK domain-containing protein 1 n=1 Tax=Polypedilum vanderplanki TaxID=319348 RepID=A0A9J6C8M2_POLVA|nr:hypothetical protein PVAND_007916 [Polypedilum vanderplanki]